MPVAMFAVAFVALAANTSGAQNTVSNSQTQSSIMDRMGFSNLRQVPDEVGEQIRGKGFLIGGGLQGQALVAAGMLDYENFRLSLGKSTNLTKMVEFEINLNDYRSILGPEFQQVDLSTKSLKISRIVDFSQDLNFDVHYTNLRGTNLVFGPAIRITGGVFP